MSTDIQSDSPENSEQKVPPHVQDFLSVTGKFDDAVRSKDEGIISSARNQLEEFYGTLTSGQQHDVQGYLGRELTGKVIEDQRSRWHRNLVRWAHVPHRVMGDYALPIARFTGETLRFLVLMLGLGIGYIVIGTRDAAREVLSKAA
jgi:hypothetical protein